MAFTISIGGARYRSRTGAEKLIYYGPQHPQYGRSRIEWLQPSYGSVPIESEDAERAIDDGTVTYQSTARTGARKYVFVTGAGPKAPKPKFRLLDLDDST